MYEVKYDKRLNQWVVEEEATKHIVIKCGQDRNRAFRECSKLRDAEDYEMLERGMLRGMPG